MTEFQISDRILQNECAEIARDIVDDFKRDNPGEDLDNHLDYLRDRACDTADGHEWVIYSYKALMLCAHCNTNDGEGFLEDVGIPESPDIYSIASLIAYGEMRARIDSAIVDILEELEAAE